MMRINPLVQCVTCKRYMIEFGKEDNFLGQDPSMCKYWCNECFEEIKEWIRKQREEVKERFKNPLSL